MNTPPAPRPIRVLLVDDHPMLRLGVASLLEPEPDMQVAGEADCGERAVELHRSLLPDVTLMDMQMPGMGGLEAIKAIRRDCRTARILVLTTYSGDVQAARAMKAGAVGYLLKSAVRTELLGVIRTVHAGRRYLPPEIAGGIATHIGDDDLTERETEILHHIAAGEPNKRIAWRLSITEDTVKAHIKSIFAKLDVADRTHAVTVAVQRGFMRL
jgi:DNA-binding NarL/FixJ family response regulator